MPSRSSADAALLDIARRCRLRWPRLTVSDADFLAHVKAHLPADGAPSVEALHLEDLFLACACAAKDPAALRVLEEVHLPRVVPALEGLRGPAGFVDEVLQVLRQKLLVGGDGRGRIADYGGFGPLDAWLRAAALRTALNARRDAVKDALPSLDALFELPSHAQDLELQVLKQRFRPHFGNILRAALAALPAKERNVLRLHFVDGLSLSQIGAGYQVDKSTVSRWLAGSRARLLAEIRAGLARALAVESVELEGLFDAVKSGLDLSLSAVLREQSSPGGPR